MGTSSAVANVFYARGIGNNMEVTKSGSYIYYGDAFNFQEWEFRARLGLKATGDGAMCHAECPELSMV